jgi:hypothetical protein
MADSEKPRVPRVLGFYFLPSVTIGLDAVIQQLLPQKKKEIENLYFCIKELHKNKLLDIDLY